MMIINYSLERNSPGAAQSVLQQEYIIQLKKKKYSLQCPLPKQQQNNKITFIHSTICKNHVKEYMQHIAQKYNQSSHGN